MRTIVNILGDCVGACVVHHWTEKDLKKLAEDNDDDGDDVE